MSEEPLIGSIGFFAGEYTPQGWADCAGQKLSIAHHEALFSLIGVIYGGDGVHEFAVPDLRPEVNGKRVDWSEVKQPRQCICVEGIYPSRW